MMRAYSRHSVKFFEAMSQTFFLKNPWFGMLLLALVLAFSPSLFVCAFIGAFIGYVFSVRSSMPFVLRESGLLPINGFFFGLAMARLFAGTPSFYFFFFLGALSLPYVTRALYEVLHHWRVGPLVAPYILTFWAVWLCGQEAFSGLHAESWPVPGGVPGTGAAEPILRMIGASTGRLLFLPDPIFGLLVVALVIAFSPRRGLGYLFGTAIAGAVSYFLLGGSPDWQLGILTFSAGLVGLGLASFPERFNARTLLFFCAVSAFFTLSTGHFLAKLDLPILSTPYILTLWLAMLSRAPRLHLQWKKERVSPTQAFAHERVGEVLPESRAA